MVKVDQEVIREGVSQHLFKKCNLFDTYLSFHPCKMDATGQERELEISNSGGTEVLIIHEFFLWSCLFSLGQEG